MMTKNITQSRQRNNARQFSQFSVESRKTRTDLVILVSWESRRLRLQKTFVLSSFLNTKFFIHWKNPIYLLCHCVWTWRRAQWVSRFCVIVDRICFQTSENERSHVATETGMLKQEFSAISVSLNNSWVTGGIEIRVLAMMDVISVRCLMSWISFSAFNGEITV